MNIYIVGSESDCRLVFEGAMTHEFSRQMEDRVIDLMRRHHCLQVDLAGVEEIDLFGVHLIGVLQNLGGHSVDIIAASPAVERALSRLLTPSRGTSLGRFVRRQDIQYVAAA
ncbi:MAG: STAS domain-containing protein [Dechloromonas sp.]|nr:STAS domain-containing protein [Dechloromonas sp.]